MQTIVWEGMGWGEGWKEGAKGEEMGDIAV